MAEKIIMPQGGQDIMEGRVVRWLKAEGDAVAKGEVVCEVETEKAVFEVVAPMEGILVKILVPAGKVAKIFATIAVVAATGEKIDLTGLLAGEEAAGDDGAAAAVTAAPAAAVTAAPAAAVTAAPAAATAAPAADPGKIKASGRAKKLADEKGVDITRVKGSGPNGRITEKDVLAHIASGAAAAPAAPPAPAAPAAPQAAAGGRGRSVPLTKMRKVIARRLQQSKQTVPHFYVTIKVDMSAALRLREEINAKVEKDGKISMNDMVIKAAARALADVPQMNCRFEEEAVVYLDEINIGVAVGLDEGLVVPVLPAVDELSLKGIAKKTKELIALAKAGKQANLVPGSFTVSNMGMLDVENFTAIINPPEAAILAVGSTVKEVQVGEDSSLRVRDVMKMTLSADHRAVDGVLAARFVNRIKSALENPQVLLG
jgi:pyruvate dehydrogenase E2 component (dihydrolipoamide acetyltransferase)